jgi:hypothetical protein
MHPITAPVAAPLAPPETALAAGSGDWAKAGMAAAKPARSAIAPMVFIIDLLFEVPGIFFRPGLKDLILEGKHPLRHIDP